MRLPRYIPGLVLLAFLGACGGSEETPAAGNDDMDEAGAAAAPAADAAADMPAMDMDLPEGVTAAMVAEGRGLFTGAGVCHACHGPDATGTQLAPDLTDDEWLNIDGSYEAIVNTVMNGVPEPREHPAPMQPRGGSQITDAQVRAVAAYVWSLSHGG